MDMWFWISAIVEKQSTIKSRFKKPKFKSFYEWNFLTFWIFEKSLISRFLLVSVHQPMNSALECKKYNLMNNVAKPIATDWDNNRMFGRMMINLQMAHYFPPLSQFAHLCFYAKNLLTHFMPILHVSIYLKFSISFQINWKETKKKNLFVQQQSHAGHPWYEISKVWWEIHKSNPKVINLQIHPDKKMLVRNNS